LVNFPWSEGGDEHELTFKPLDNDAGFSLDIEGRKVVALKLPNNIAKEVAGQKSGGTGRFSEIS